MKNISEAFLNASESFNNFSNTLRTIHHEFSNNISNLESSLIYFEELEDYEQCRLIKEKIIKLQIRNDLD